MIIFLIIVMSVLAFRETDKNKKIAMMVFVCEKAFSELYFIFLNELFFRPVGFQYYGVMAIFDFITIFVLSNLSIINIVSVSLQKICIASIIFNLFAFVCWHNHIKHAEIYNFLYVFIYLFSIVIMIKTNDERKNKTKQIFFLRRLRLIN